MTESIRTAVTLPEVEVIDDCAFATESVLGRYGITAEIPDMHHVVEWQEFRAIPFQGYYRLILPPVVKQLQAAVRTLYQVPCVIMYTSAAMALKELLEYLWLEKNLRSVATGGTPEMDELVDRLVSIPLDGSGASVFLANGPLGEVVPQPESLSILYLDTLPENPAAIRGFDYVVAGVAAEGSPVTTGVILSYDEDEAKLIHERNRRRGACVVARDAAWLLQEDAELTVQPGIREALTRQLCARMGGQYGTLYPSGMCAVTVALECLRAKSGKSRFVVVGHPYSDTHLLCQHMPWAGPAMEAIMLAGHDLDGLEAALAEDTAGVIVETISNPLNEVPDLPRIVAICRVHGVPLVVDNTMATPYNCQPLSLGADLVVHSTAKYLSGTNDHGGGAIVTNDEDLYRFLDDYRSRWQLDMSPLEAEILLQALESFDERMAVFNRNGLAVAEWLQQHPAVDEVYFAMLPDHPDNEVARRLLQGGGSVVSFTLKAKGFEPVRRFYDTEMPLVKKAPSLGSNITLMCPYTLLTYYQKDDEYLKNYRLDRYLLRISVGCEDPLDPILQNLNRALEASHTS